MQVGELLEAVAVLAIEEEGVGVVGEDEVEASVLGEEQVEDGGPILILHGQAASGVEAFNILGSLGMRMASWCYICVSI